ncbi:LacI family transcriptional regulator [Paenibacillus baekrokdamisoli]|uniref:LacI family transcriptional regulator n=1 Tax=Paenibacillus baekrokdamisoli TaxID=1712516 RepID=A0A3G9IYR7_9BACL|nr:LacI family DNA-binding transcriptional regulator [Paenibacillus baekrokdamisoli]MBB3071950.1 LacI family sucrose operon transcriptional repressor [Paenibacillus baekrokdamisoli]BBH24067.1 LacI family transcriptional regulator [Paenibacillus baekrokdamisoli]
MPTIDDVARKAGVSVTTVSRILNNRGYIGNATREKVYQVMKEINYQPNELARSLFRKKSNLIGLIIPEIAHPFFSELTQYIEYYAFQNGYKLLLCNSEHDRTKEKEYIDMLKKNQVDGIIMGSMLLETDDYLQLNLPIVSFDRSIADHVPLVTSDNNNGGLLAAKILIDKGCRQLAFLYGGIKGYSGNYLNNKSMLAGLRYDGFSSECKRRNVENLNFYLEINNFANLDSIVEQIICFFQENKNVDGIFATSDVIAAYAIQACSKMDKKIPEHVKIVGYDDVILASLMAPSGITSIKQPIEEMAKQSVELIIKQINGEHVEKGYTLEVTLVERGTT